MRMAGEGELMESKILSDQIAVTSDSYATVVIMKIIACVNCI